MKRKTTTNTALRPLESIVWVQAMVDRLKELDKKWTRAIDFWFSRVKEGYIIEFVVEYTNYFRDIERKFTYGPMKRLLVEIPLWIKMLFMEKGMMHMDPDMMVEYISLDLGGLKDGGK